MRYQRTITESIECAGVGLHTGINGSLSMHPAPPDTGIVFRRANKKSVVEARVENVVATEYSSKLGLNGSSVQTVEHLLAAIAGLSIDNLYIEVDSPEVPIMDGSAYPFVELISGAGIRHQDRVKPYIKIIEPIEIREADSYIKIEPSPFPLITYIMDFDHPLLSKQKLVYHYSAESFMADIAPARTFGFLKDALILKEKGLGKGVSLDNVIVLGETGILNREGLRFKDEFIRHKILDLIGDMALLSRPFIGHITACRSGHSLNTRLAAAILDSSNKWTEVGISEQGLEVR